MGKYVKKPPFKGRLNGMDQVLSINLSHKIEKYNEQAIQLAIDITKLQFKHAKVRQKMNNCLQARMNLRRPI